MDEAPEGSPGPKKYFDAHPRLFGVVLFAFVAIFAMWAFYLPIREASRGAPQVTLYPKAIFACVAFGVFGVICLILGSKTYPVALKIAALRGWQKWLTFAAIIIPLIILGDLVKQGFERYLEGVGYKF